MPRRKAVHIVWLGTEHVNTIYAPAMANGELRSVRANCTDGPQSFALAAVLMRLNNATGGTYCHERVFLSLPVECRLAA